MQTLDVYVFGFDKGVYTFIYIFLLLDLYKHLNGKIYIDISG